MLSIYLVGFMGAGKSAVGAIVARRLGREFVDLDAAVERRLGMTVRETFERGGEAAFRTAESAELERTVGRAGLVVATGGGAFSSAANRDLIHGSGGVSVFLDPPWSAILRRLGDPDPDRPNWVDEHHASALYHQRRPDYLLATLHLEPEDRETPEVVAGMVCDALAEVPCAT